MQISAWSPLRFIAREEPLSSQHVLAPHRPLHPPSPDLVHDARDEAPALVETTITQSQQMRRRYSHATAGLPLKYGLAKRPTILTQLRLNRLPHLLGIHVERQHKIPRRQVRLYTLGDCGAAPPSASKRRVCCRTRFSAVSIADGLASDRSVLPIAHPAGGESGVGEGGAG